MIGIIVAEQKELESVKPKMRETKQNKIYELNFIEGKIANQECVLVQSGGVGKVNAARTVQILIDNYKPNYVVNIGSAGALNKKLNIGDIVIGKKIVQHDFDITAFGRKKGEVNNVGEYIESNEKLIEKCENVINTIFENKENKAIIGTIATGDTFCTRMEMKKAIIREFAADCTEMEGAAIAQVCKLDNVPFIVIRSISDRLDGNNKVEFETYLETASEICANFLEKLMSH